jgi:hypothetical protein
MILIRNLIESLLFETGLQYDYVRHQYSVYCLADDNEVNLGMFLELALRRPKISWIRHTVISKSRIISERLNPFGIYS